jgi:hypothetical protein
MRERGLDVDHSTVFRWVQRYAPEINKRVRQHLKMSGTSYRVDETYIKGQCCEDYIRTQKITGSPFSGGDLKERSNEPRLTYRIATG